MTDTVALARIFPSLALKLLIARRHVLHRPSVEEQLGAAELKGVKGTGGSGSRRQTIFPTAALSIPFWGNVTDEAPCGVISVGVPGPNGFPDTAPGPGLKELEGC